MIYKEKELIAEVLLKKRFEMLRILSEVIIERGDINEIFRIR